MVYSLPPKRLVHSGEVGAKRFPTKNLQLVVFDLSHPNSMVSVCSDKGLFSSSITQNVVPQI